MIAQPSTVNLTKEIPEHASADPLVALLLRVARRADEIAATLKDRTSLNLPCWLQAEEEIFGKPGLRQTFGAQRRTRRSA